jgi:broad specificity phosphatase PhoE
MSIYLLRHAEVAHEYLGRYNGHIDIPLSENGIQQTRELAKQLSGIKFDKIYCSDLKRAKDTLKELNIDATTIYSDQLREKSWGKHEGMSFDEIQKSGIEYKNFKQWISSLDGEDVELYIQKIKHYFYNTIFEDKSQNILVVTHSGVIKTIHSILNNIELEDAFNIKIEYSQIYSLNSYQMII